MQFMNIDTRFRIFYDERMGVSCEIFNTDNSMYYMQFVPVARNHGTISYCTGFTVDSTEYDSEIVAENIFLALKYMWKTQYADVSYQRFTLMGIVVLCGV